MSEPIADVILPTITTVLKNNPLPKNEGELADYVSTMMGKCEKEARKKFIISPNQLGRLNGDWFEYLFDATIKPQLGEKNIQVFPGRGHHINEIKGFEDVDWIPMPDAIVKDFQDFRAVVSLKWGMRHDRMYQPAFEAYAIKDWINRNNLQKVKVFLFTNDNFSGYQARLEILPKVPALDGVFYLEFNKLSPELKKKIKSFPDLINELKSISK